MKVKKMASAFRLNIGVAQMSLAMFLSGFIGLFVFESEQTPFNIVFFRCVFGAIGLGLFCWWKGYFTADVLNKKNITLALLSGFALVCNWILLFTSFKLSPISINTAIYHTQPFFLVLFGALFLGEAFSFHKFVWLILAFLGLIFVIELDANSFQGDTFMIEGAGYALGAAILYTATTIITKRLTGMRPHLIAFIQVTLGIVMLSPLVDFSTAPTLADTRVWGYLLALGLINTCFMYIILYSAFQKLQTPVIAVLSFIYPVVALGVDYIFYDQMLSILQFTGIVFILVSAAAVNLGWKVFPSRVKVKES